jgi:hypothetical protein
LAIHTDSKITLDAIANPSNHQKLVEQIREEIRRLENDNWIIHFTWVKEHDGNYGNKLADQLAKEAACSSQVDIAYIKIPKSAVTSELKGKRCTSVGTRMGHINQGRINKNILPHCKRQNI